MFTVALSHAHSLTEHPFVNHYDDQCQPKFTGPHHLSSSCQPPPPVKDGPTIGVDVGITKLAVCSEGTVVENPKALGPALKHLRKLDKAIARSGNVHGRTQHSNRRERLYAKRRRLHARIANVRSDAHHKGTRR